MICFVIRYRVIWITAFILRAPEKTHGFNFSLSNVLTLPSDGGLVFDKRCSDSHAEKIAHDECFVQSPRGMRA